MGLSIREPKALLVRRKDNIGDSLLNGYLPIVLGEVSMGVFN